MIIYGTAILAICHLLGDYLGNTLGMVLGVKANVGGVAISMILLILSKELLAKKVTYHKSPSLAFYIGQACTFRLWLQCQLGKTLLLHYRGHVRADCLYCIINWYGFSHPLFK